MEGTAMTTLLGGITTITTLVGDTFTMITGNPLLTVFAATSLVGVGIGVFRRLKRAAR